MQYSSLHSKIKFSIKDFFSKCDQNRCFLLIWSHLLKKSLMENFIFCAVRVSFKKNKKTKKRHENLNEMSVVDNKLFRKTVKPLLSDKVAGKDKIHLVENNELVKIHLETADVLNNFFFHCSTEP